MKLCIIFCFQMTNKTNDDGARISDRACVLGRITHCLSTSVSVFFSLPLSPSSTVAPQEQLGIMDGLGDHITVSKET